VELECAMREHMSREVGARRMQRATLRAAADPLRRAARLLVALALSLAFSACSTTRSRPPASEAPAAGPYVVGEGDLLAVRVWKNQELSVEVPVRPDGMISVPLLNDVRAAGMTTEQLKTEITGKLTEFITNPDVTVVVLRPDSKRVFVLGEVAHPGPVPLASNLTVIDVLSAAGGLTPFADDDDIRIIRRGDGGAELEFEFDYGAYVRGRAPGTNLMLQPGDKIVVPK
jgi:polysaccharide export outer membrane protein